MKAGSGSRDCSAWKGKGSEETLQHLKVHKGGNIRKMTKNLVGPVVSGHFKTDMW